MQIRILIVDDHGVLRAGLRTLLNAEDGLEVVGEARDGEQALQLAKVLQPDLVLLDLSMPGMDGLEVTRRMKELLPGAKIVILTMHEDKSLLRAAIRAGASGYVLKRAVEADLLSAIQAAQRGEIYVHPAMTRLLLVDDSGEKSLAPERIDATLTLREFEVLQRIVRGYTNRQIADELSLSVRTVESHRANLMSKLNLRSRVDLVRYATEHGLLKDAG